MYNAVMPIKTKPLLHLLTETIVARFWKRVCKEPTPLGCWLWTGCLDRKGYGSMGLGPQSFGGNGRTSRIALTLALQRDLLPGELALHKCDNPACVNTEPGHLYAGTPLQNNIDCVTRGRNCNSRKTHCKHGHEFTPDNTGLKIHYKRGPHAIERYCRACRHAYYLRTPKSVRKAYKQAAKLASLARSSQASG